MHSIKIDGPIREAESFLRALEAARGEDITVTMDSIGGDVWAGLQMHNALVQYPGRTTIHIVGTAASMASAVAMAGDMIIIEPEARMMLHSPSAATKGDAASIRRIANLLESIETTMAAIYATRSDRPVAVVEDMLRRETWLSAGDAVAAGLADAVSGTEQPTRRTIEDVTVSFWKTYNQKHGRS